MKKSMCLCTRIVNGTIYQNNNFGYMIRREPFKVGFIIPSHNLVFQFSKYDNKWSRWHRLAVVYDDQQWNILRCLLVPLWNLYTRQYLLSQNGSEEIEMVELVPFPHERKRTLSQMHSD